MTPIRLQQTRQVPACALMPIRNQAPPVPFVDTMTSPTWLFSLLQVFLGLAGMTWKLSEGYPIMHVHAALDASSWLEMCTGTSAASFQSNWPWFTLHLVLYAGQLAGFVLIVLHETVPHTGPFRGFGYVEPSVSSHQRRQMLTTIHAAASLPQWPASPAASASRQPCPSCPSGSCTAARPSAWPQDERGNWPYEPPSGSRASHTSVPSWWPLQQPPCLRTGGRSISPTACSGCPTAPCRSSRVRRRRRDRPECGR